LNALSGFLAKGNKKFLWCDSSLLKHAAERSNLDLAMIGYNAPRRTAAKNDVTAALTDYHKPKPFKCSDCFRT